MKFWIQVEFGLHATQSGQSARLPVPAAGSGQIRCSWRSTRSTVASDIHTPILPGAAVRPSLRCDRSMSFQTSYNSKSALTGFSRMAWNVQERSFMEQPGRRFALWALTVCWGPATVDAGSG